MKINYILLALQIANEIQTLPAMKRGDEETLPTIHVKSGTTTVDVDITVRQDAPKK